MYGRVWPVLAVLASSLAGVAAASGINGINGGMPNRISMNVTVPKQTQGATFGEKVQSGLQSAGGAVANGASLVIECGTSACAVALPDGTGYRADLQSMTVSALDPAQGQALRKVAGAASLLGGSLPGGSIVSAAVSSVGKLGGGGASTAAYAATGRIAAAAPLASRSRDDGSIEVVDPMVEGDYVLTLEVVPAGAATRGAAAAQSMKPAAARIRMRLVLSATDGALRARADSSVNSISAATGGG